MSKRTSNSGGLELLKKDLEVIVKHREVLDQEIKRVTLAIRILEIGGPEETAKLYQEEEDGKGRGAPFRIKVLEELKKSPGVPMRIGKVTRLLSPHIQFHPPYRNGLRNRVSVELAAMARSWMYGVYRVAAGEYE